MSLRYICNCTRAIYRSGLVWPPESPTSHSLTQTDCGSSGTRRAPQNRSLSLSRKRLVGKKLLKFVSFQIIVIGRLGPAFVGFSQVLFASVSQCFFGGVEEGTAREEAVRLRLLVYLFIFVFCNDVKVTVRKVFMTGITSECVGVGMESRARTKSWQRETRNAERQCIQV